MDLGSVFDIGTGVSGSIYDRSTDVCTAVERGKLATTVGGSGLDNAVEVTE